MMRLHGVAISVALVTSTCRARADEVPVATPAVSWYGWQIVLADAASVGAFLLEIPLSSAAGSSSAGSAAEISLGTLGGLGYLAAVR
jgi:hypothetical protein